MFEARESTFTTPLDGPFGRGVQNFINNIPILRQIMPFIQTPTNIIRTSFERAPCAKHADEKAARNALKGTPEERAMVVGNTAVGVMTTVTAINFAMQGRITGGGPSFSK